MQKKWLAFSTRRCQKLCCVAKRRTLDLFWLATLSCTAKKRSAHKATHRLRFCYLPLFASTPTPRHLGRRFAITGSYPTTSSCTAHSATPPFAVPKLRRRLAPLAQLPPTSSVRDLTSSHPCRTVRISPGPLDRKYPARLYHRSHLLRSTAADPFPSPSPTLPYPQQQSDGVQRRPYLLMLHLSDTCESFISRLAC